MPFAVQLPSSSDGALAKGGRRPADDKEQSLTPLGTSLQVTQRPTFVFENGIGDKAVLSGLVRAEPLFATLDAMLVDDAAYAAYRESVGVPPP